MWLEMTKSKSYVKTTTISTKATVVEGIKLCCYLKKKNMKIELKSQQPWTAVLVSLGRPSMAQLHLLAVPC